jgi:hypothetical protein
MATQKGRLGRDDSIIVDYQRPISYRVRDVSSVSFNSLLLLERVQLTWFPG